MNCKREGGNIKACFSKLSHRLGSSEKESNRIDLDNDLSIEMIIEKTY